ncbi:Zn(II)2Cys6 transcription factor [Aspergillus ellipticus CBS 707.79]|uniref:Zn(II)2Cys6 transcription factor n=1 Tax=Aspergillus ellipticus CBS 707.79 TaxID=1448320 RepID=A0A319DNS4_9EURO|nr:Zn(II)2Cys6 transcription factor [Aspergillus ellipticus CBS 707.79]
MPAPVSDGPASWIRLFGSGPFITSTRKEQSEDSDGGNTTDAQLDTLDKHPLTPEDLSQNPDQASALTHLPFPEVIYSQHDSIRPLHGTGVPSGALVSESHPLVASSSALSPPTINTLSPLASVSTWTGSTSPLSSVSPRPSSSPPMTSREAHLLRLFIHKIAPWADICDLRSHFTTEIPRRALQVPMVLKAVLSLAARHDAIMSDTSDWEASEYHGQCLELLIVALALPEDTYDDNLLITVVILRIYEELECLTDEKCHWVGSNRLLNTMSKSASSGGLAEAVSWQFLRQAIYASIVQHQPMQLDLANYERSAVFEHRDDASYANVIIFLCAKIIQLCGKSHCTAVDETDWQDLSDSVEQWHRARPISWQPLQYKGPNPDENRPFPELWMMSPPAVVGLQYYHASQIFLTSANNHWATLSDYELARQRRIEEKTIASHLVRVIGLSMSNETVENAYFMGCHLLHRYGYSLRHPSEQQGSLKFLRRVEKVVGWRTAWMVRELRAQWNELTELDTWQRSDA